MEPAFDTVAIIGPGLVGGSLGMAVRSRGLARRVVGIGRRQSSLDEALRVGACDEVTLDAAEGVRPADLVVLATPISTFARLAPVIVPALKTGALLTEVASTKQSVIATVRACLADRPDVVFVPTHPMAGSEKRGAGNASRTLFEGSVCIFTPLDAAPREAVAALRVLWQTVGATVHVMGPVEHDRLVAHISHLPHLAAAGLMEVVTPQESAFAGGGLVDTTRVASGNARLWRDICESNSDQIVHALGAYADAIDRLRALLAQGRFDELEQLLARAKAARDELLVRRAMRSGGEL